MSQFENLRTKWLHEHVSSAVPATFDEIALFQKVNNVCLPKDLAEYLTSLNGTADEYTDNLYQFYSLERIKNVIEEFKDWQGIPDYKKSPIVLKDPEKIFVFANYQFNLFAYGIRLDSDAVIENSVLVICGDQYKIIAKSFSDFISLYLDDSIELQLNK